MLNVFSLFRDIPHNNLLGVVMNITFYKWLLIGLDNGILLIIFPTTCIWKKVILHFSETYINFTPFLSKLSGFGVRTALRLSVVDGTSCLITDTVVPFL